MGCALCVVSKTGFIKRNKTWGTSDLFGEIRQPATDYVVTPRHVSETRKYWTAQTNSPSVIRGDANMLVSDPIAFQMLVSASSPASVGFDYMLMPRTRARCA